MVCTRISIALCFFFSLVSQLVKMTDESIAAGAKVVRGGKPGGGLFYPPTLLTGVSGDMPVAKEEIFGPVAPILKFREEDEVVRIANTSDMGLAGRTSVVLKFV